MTENKWNKILSQKQVQVNVTVLRLPCHFSPLIYTWIR